MASTRKIDYTKAAGILLIVLFSYAVYHGSLHIPVLAEDIALIGKDERITSLANIPVFFTAKYWKEEAPYRGANFRPFRTITFAIDYFFWKSNVSGYHFTNLCFHIFNGLLLYFLAHLLLQPFHGFSDSAIGRYTPILAALFFAVHPIHTEAVVWIKNRSELFATFFLISSFLCFIKGQNQDKLDSSGSTRGLSRHWYYLLSAVFYTAGLLSKETAIVLPFLIGFYYAFLFPDDLSVREKGKKILLRTLPFWALAILYTVLRFSLISSVAPWEPAPVLDLSTRISLVIKTVGMYVKVLTWPVDLSTDRVFAVPESFFQSDMLMYAGVIIFLLAGIVMLLTRVKPIYSVLAFALFWIFISILPASNIYYMHIRPFAEQRLYIPSIGFCIFLAILVVQSAESVGTSRRISIRQVLVLLTTFGILAAYSVGTIVRTADWRDPVGFWEKTVRLHPGHWRSHWNLGLLYINMNKTDEGIQQIEHTLRVAPKLPGPYFDLGDAYGKKGKLDQAAAMYEKGMRLMNPINTQFLLGRFYQRKGLKEQAINSFKRYLAIHPDYGEAHFNLAGIYEGEKQYEQAAFHYEQVIRIEPYHQEIDRVYYNLGNIYLLKGQRDKTLQYWENISDAGLDSLEVRVKLVEFYKERKLYSKAIEHYKKAAEMYPASWDIFFNLGVLHEKQELFQEGAAYYERAVKFNPNFAEAHYNLGMLYLKYGRFNDAARLFQRVIYLDPTNIEAPKMNQTAMDSARRAK